VKLLESRGISSRFGPIDKAGRQKVVSRYLSTFGRTFTVLKTDDVMLNRISNFDARTAVALGRKHAVVIYVPNPIGRRGKGDG